MVVVDIAVLVRQGIIGHMGVSQLGDSFEMGFGDGELVTYNETGFLDRVQTLVHRKRAHVVLVIDNSDRGFLLIPEQIHNLGSPFAEFVDEVRGLSRDELLVLAIRTLGFIGGLFAAGCGGDRGGNSGWLIP
jgi:hypothetical protein